MLFVFQNTLLGLDSPPSIVHHPRLGWGMAGQGKEGPGKQGRAGWGGAGQGRAVEKAVALLL